MPRPYEDQIREPSEQPGRGNGEQPPKHISDLTTGSFLLAAEFPEIKWGVQGMIPEGVTILAGKPKMGKSWMALAFSIAAATGGRALGEIPVTKTKVLYLALEDNQRRLQKRLRILTEAGVNLDDLLIVTRFPRIGEGGMTELYRILDEHPDIGFIVVDTLARFRKRVNAKENSYQADYDAITGLHTLAHDNQIAILAVHHLKKMDEDDPFDAISGTTGLTGAVDGALVLKRQRGQADAELHVDGRDIEDTEPKALKFDGITAQWILIGNSSEIEKTIERQEIIDALDYGEGRTAREVAEKLDKPYDNVRRIMERMRDDEKIDRCGGDKRNGYTYKRHTNYTSHANRDDETDQAGAVDTVGIPPIPWEYQLTGKSTWSTATLKAETDSQAMEYLQQRFGTDRVMRVRRVNATQADLS